MVGQDEKFRAAESSFSHGYYSIAAPLYTELLKKDSTDVYINLKAGLCYLSSKSQKYKAVIYLQQAVIINGTLNSNYPDSLIAPFIHSLGSDRNKKISREDVRLIAYRFLGDAYYFINQFDRAITCYEKVKATIQQKNNSTDLIDNLNKNIDLCYFGKRLTQLNADVLKLEPVTLQVRAKFIRSALKSTLNSHSDRSGGIFCVNSKDGSASLGTTTDIKIASSKPDPKLLLFDNTLNRSISNNLQKERFDLQLKSTTPDYTIEPVNYKRCSEKTASDMYVKGNEATVGTSTDGQLVLVYRVNTEGLGNLYTTRLINNEWTNPEPLDKIVNTKGWETGECISVDGSVMYFTSDKPGGYGGKDIYLSRKQPDGSWGKEENLGSSINTRQDEDAPFIYPNGTTLYFRSNGHQASGCFDIFISSLSDTGWAVPVNVGYPVDILADESLETAYRSPSQHQTDMQNTNYLATFYNLDKVPLTLVKRQIVDINNKPVKNVTITITSRDGSTSAIYNSNDNTGNYLFVLPANYESYIHYEAKGYFFQSELIDFPKMQSQYQTFKPVHLKPFSKESVLELNTLYFKNRQLISTSVAMAELDHIATFLAANSTFSAQVVSYVAHKDSGRLNKQMAREHSQRIADYLMSKGIAKERINCSGYGKIKHKAARKTGIAEQYEIKLRNDNLNKV